MNAHLSTFLKNVHLTMKQIVASTRNQHIRSPYHSMPLVSPTQQPRTMTSTPSFASPPLARRTVVDGEPELKRQCTSSSRASLLSGDLTDLSSVTERHSPSYGAKEYDSLLPRNSCVADFKMCGRCYSKAVPTTQHSFGKCSVCAKDPLHPRTGARAFCLRCNQFLTYPGDRDHDSKACPHKAWLMKLTKCILCSKDHAGQNEDDVVRMCEFVFFYLKKLTENRTECREKFPGFCPPGQRLDIGGIECQTVEGFLDWMLMLPEAHDKTNFHALYTYLHSKIDI